jgi:hypothetical protein
MPKIEYQSINFKPATLALIELCETILDEYAAAGYDMTLRQLYYQLVSRDIIPNKQTEYKRLGSIVNDARLAGLIDWGHIVDRTRNLRTISSWATPHSIVRSAAYSYHMDRWANQSYRPEIWIEKDALVGVFTRIANELDVPLFSCRGYTSQSEVWGAAQRMIEYEADGKQAYIIHFGDHDPSGIDMSRDIQDRLKLFGVDLEFERLALNMDQIRKYNPPPNPAKLTDSRCVGYMKKFGQESWELDALEPKVLGNLVRSNIQGLINQDAWEEVEEQEAEDKRILEMISERYEDVKAFLEEE